MQSISLKITSIGCFIFTQNYHKKREPHSNQIGLLKFFIKIIIVLNFNKPTKDREKLYTFNSQTAVSWKGRIYTKATLNSISVHDQN